MDGGRGSRHPGWLSPLRSQPPAAPRGDVLFRSRRPVSPPMTAAASTISGLRSHGARNRDGMSEGCGWLGSALVPRQRRPCKYRRGEGTQTTPASRRQEQERARLQAVATETAQLRALPRASEGHGPQWLGRRLPTTRQPGDPPSALRPRGPQAGRQDGRWAPEPRHRERRAGCAPGCLGSCLDSDQQRPSLVKTPRKPDG